MIRRPKPPLHLPEAPAEALRPDWDSPPGSAPADRPRPTPVRTAIVYTSTGRTTIAPVKNLSPGGFELLLRRPRWIGEVLQLRLVGVGLLRAQVACCWPRQGGVWNICCTFPTPLPVETLARLLS